MLPIILQNIFKRLNIIHRLFREALLKYKEEKIMEGLPNSSLDSFQIDCLRLCIKYVELGNTQNIFRVLNFLDLKQVQNMSMRDASVSRLYNDFNQAFVKIAAKELMKNQFLEKILTDNTMTLH